MDLENSLATQEEELKFTDGEIFSEIWFNPRKIFKYINDNSYDKFIYVLLFFGGVASAFNRASLKDLGNSFSLAGVIAVCIIAGGLFGWISYYIYAALLSWTGKWLDGKGDTTSLLRMISFSMLPSICALVLLIPQIILFGNSIFQSDFNFLGFGVFATVIYLLIAIAEVVLGIWTIVLFVIGLSEVQKLSVGKSILNLLLPAFVVFIPLLIIVLMVKAIF